MHKYVNDVKVLDVMVLLGRQALLSAPAVAKRLYSEHDDQGHRQEKRNERDQEDIHLVVLLDGRLLAARGNHIGTNQ